MPTDNNNVTERHPLPWYLDDETAIHDKNDDYVQFDDTIRAFVVSVVNATQRPASVGDKSTPTDAAWTPATTPPTGTGWYPVLYENWRHVWYRAVDYFNSTDGWRYSEVSFYLPTPLPELPEDK
jgi:hypothetical protein